MKVFTNYNNLIINTLIAVNEKENRKIIDYIDIQNYKNILEKKAKAKGIEIAYHSDDNNQEFLSEYVYYDKDAYGNLFGVKPWHKSSDLYDSRNNLPFNICMLFCDSTILTEMPNRSLEDIKRLNKFNDSVIISCINDLEHDWNNLKEKYQSVGSTKELEDKCLKIKKKIAEIQVNRKL